MDLSNLRKSKKGKDTPAARLTQSDNSNQDAAPGQKSPKNIMETDTWKKSQSGISSLWRNYLDILAKYFRNYRRPEQVRLITTMCTVVTIGCATVLVTLFYPFIPQFVRLFAVPAIMVGSWFVATKVVSPIIIAQLEDKLNQD
ncbi:MAG TPA: hypothetical protein PKD05_05635 [Candidatus Melainabacteria bacterium]|nr:hypothetical protein [Candidatus Melainabacteria bacterium]